ncbi:MAG: cell division ATP-binding protein FtsE [Desulfobacterota bacterium]|nr:cell division ATP-binding protein FtsE [Thermodesulfobacteriota bacterium]
MIEFHNVSKCYNSTPALSDINLTINKGDFVFLTGPSGAGKTTLLKLIFLSERPTEGEIIVNGVNITRMKSSAIPHFRRKLGVVFQDFKLLPGKTVFENVALGLEIIGLNRKLIKRRVWQVVKWVGLLQKIDSYPPYLSGGEQQRVAIARAIINNPMLLLADEPTGNLDPGLALEIMKLFKAINTRGTTIVIATHNRDMAETFSHNIVALSHGRLLEHSHLSAS